MTKDEKIRLITQEEYCEGCENYELCKAMNESFKKSEESYVETKEGECKKETVQDTYD